MMTQEEEIKMMNSDHEIWKQAKGYSGAPKEVRGYVNILNIPSMKFDTQLEMLIQDFLATRNMNAFKYSTFSFTRPLFIDLDNQIPLCTTDEEYARRWLFQINNRLTTDRRGAIASISNDDMSTIESVFSTRCVLLTIDPCEGSIDKSICGMNYFGLVVSHYNTEQSCMKHAEVCDKMYRKLEEGKE